jgi:hypothetical protein
MPLWAGFVLESSCRSLCGQSPVTSMDWWKPAPIGSNWFCQLTVNWLIWFRIFKFWEILKNLKMKKSDDNPEKSSNKLKKSVGLSFFIHNSIDKSVNWAVFWEIERFSPQILKFEFEKGVVYAYTPPPPTAHISCPLQCGIRQPYPKMGPTIAVGML